MPAKKQDQVLVACPHCGHQQAEPRDGLLHHLQKMRPASPRPGNPPSGAHAAPERAPKQRHITCFECGAELGSARQRRIHHVQMVQPLRGPARLSDHHRHGQKFQDQGHAGRRAQRLCFQHRNSSSATPSSRENIHGKLAVERSLTIYSTADIKGSLTAAHLVIPAENHFRWPESARRRVGGNCRRTRGQSARPRTRSS